MIQRIANLGITADLQQRIGAFAVTWGLFESTLEYAIWSLRNEDVRDARPSTERMQVGEWLDVLGQGHSTFSTKANEVLRMAAIAGEDLMNYRHSLFHGHLLAFGTPGQASFLRNPAWHGETRKRPVGDAHVSLNLLDMAIEAAYYLLVVAKTVPKAQLEPSETEKLEAMLDDVGRAKSFACELRNLTALMNYEKY